MSQQAQKSGNWLFIIDGASAVITGYDGTAKSLKIPSQIKGMNVAKIGRNAFSQSPVTEITIPESVSIIEGYAFSKSSIKSIIFSKGLKTIGEYAFQENLELKSINIPDGVTKIEKGAFINCSFLSTVIFPDTLTSIGESAFKNCVRLTLLLLPPKLKAVPDSVFSNCKLSSLIIPASVKTIGKSAFADNEIYELTLNEGLSAIEKMAFSNNKIAGNLTIPQTVKNISSGAFTGNQLAGVEIRGKTKIEDRAFSQNNLSQAIIGKNVIAIEKAAFKDNPALNSVTIPEEVKYKVEAFDLNVTILTGNTDGMALGNINAKALAGNTKVNRIDSTRVTFYNAKGQQIGYGLNRRVYCTSFVVGYYKEIGAASFNIIESGHGGELVKVEGHITADGIVYKSDGQPIGGMNFSTAFENGVMKPAAKEEAERIRIGHVTVEGDIGVAYEKNGTKVGEARGGFEYTLPYTGAMLALVLNHNPKNAPFSYSKNRHEIPMSPEEYAIYLANQDKKEKAKATEKTTPTGSKLKSILKNLLK
ncbi:MAG: leucine-rich repeat domain-containing protein [Lachnospiraceae bacterium]|nr:leucine-rich repeat domain-containing protein [Lachnospiraceae bacterium]